MMMTPAQPDDHWLEDDITEKRAIQEWTQHHPWKILIVDDEPDVHSMTRLALRDVHYRGRPLELLSAYSAKEGFAALRDNPDTAIILLDVVMETDDAGLQLASRIRNELKTHLSASSCAQASLGRRRKRKSSSITTSTITNQKLN